MGQDRSDRCAFDIHVKTEDEDRVEDDIGDGTDQDGDHALASETLGIDEEIHAERDHDEGCAEDVDAEIVFRRLESLIRGAEIGEEIVLPEVDQGNDDNCKPQQIDEGFIQDFRSFLLVLLTQLDG